MRLSTVALVIAGVVTVGATGCTTKPTGSGDGASAQPPTPNATTAAALRDPVVGSASVPDDAGDGMTADIRNVRLTIDGSALTVVYELTSAPPTAGTALLSVDGREPGWHSDPTARRQVDRRQAAGVRVRLGHLKTGQPPGGERPAARHDRDGRVSCFGRCWVGWRRFEWHADSNVNGNNVDRAPDADRAKFPELV